MQWFDVFYPTKDRANWTMEMVKLWDNVTWWANINNNFLKKRHSMDGGKGSKCSFPNKKSRCTMDFEVIVLSLLSMDNQGGHGVVRKVHIERSNHMPSTIELVGKTSENDLNKHTNNVL
jgi:hypothetical protein